MFATVVLVLLLAAQVSAFAPFVRSFGALKLTRASNVLRTPLKDVSDDKSTWLVEEDTSELECESFSSLQRRKEAEEKERVAAESMAAEALVTAAAETQKAEAASMSSKKEETKQEPKAEPVKVQSAVVPAKAPAGSAGGSLTPGKEKQSGFDIGLLILFPVMIGTLGLFLFFPLIGGELAKNLPPVGTP
jgi:hypothetical protein